MFAHGNYGRHFILNVSISSHLCVFSRIREKLPQAVTNSLIPEKPPNKPRITKMRFSHISSLFNLLVLVTGLQGPAPPEDCVVDELRPLPEDPTKFWSCTPHGPELMDCAEGLVFNPDLNRCEGPDSGDGSL